MAEKMVELTIFAHIEKTTVMRILFISGSTANAGSPMALFNMACGLKERGHEIAVVFPGHKGPILKRFEDAGFKLYCDEKYGLSINPSVLNIFQRRKKIKALTNNTHLKGYVHYVINDFNPDVVHTNIGPLNIAFNICQELGIPHVWHLREYQDLDMGIEFYPSKEKFIEKIHSAGNHSIAISQGIFDHWSLGINDRIIYDGIYSKKNIPEFYSGEKENVFLFVGRLTRAKGFGMMLTTFKKFLKTHPGYQLQVVGKGCGIYGCWWKLWSKLSLPSGSIKYFGTIHSADIFGLMKKAKATVVPSKFEAFCFVGAEAMLNGCVVIGKNTAGMKEQLDNGLRISGREIGIRFSTKQELLDRLDMVADGKDDFSQMKAAARQVVLDSYSIEKNAEQVEALYNEILAR